VCLYGLWLRKIKSNGLIQLSSRSLFLIVVHSLEKPMDDNTCFMESFRKNQYKISSMIFYVLMS